MTTLELVLQEALGLASDCWVWLWATEQVHSVAPQARSSFCSFPDAMQMPLRVCSCIQVLVESTTFLFFISVAMFFPGLPSPALRAHSSCSHQATPRLVAHHSLDSFGQSSHIFLANKRKSYSGYQQSPLENMYSVIYGNSKIVGLPSLTGTCSLLLK